MFYTSCCDYNKSGMRGETKVSNQQRKKKTKVNLEIALEEQLYLTHPNIDNAENDIYSSATLINLNHFFVARFDYIYIGHT